MFSILDFDQGKIVTTSEKRNFQNGLDRVSREEKELVNLPFFQFYAKTNS